MHIQLAPASADVPIHTIRNPRTNLGRFVLAALEQPEKTLPGRYVLAAVEQTTTGKLLEDWSKVTGNKAVYVQTSVDDYDRIWPGWGRAEGLMFQYYDEFGEEAWSAEGGVIIKARDLGIPIETMDGVKDTLREMQI